jgi:hypothetical protein
VAADYVQVYRDLARHAPPFERKINTPMLDRLPNNGNGAIQ